MLERKERRRKILIFSSNFFVPSVTKTYSSWILILRGKELHSLKLNKFCIREISWSYVWKKSFFFLWKSLWKLGISLLRNHLIKSSSNLVYYTNRQMSQSIRNPLLKDIVVHNKWKVCLEPVLKGYVICFTSEKLVICSK